MFSLVSFNFNAFSLATSSTALTYDVCIDHKTVNENKIYYAIFPTRFPIITPKNDPINTNGKMISMTS